MTCYSTEQRTKKYVKEYEFLSFSRNPCNKYERQLLDTGLHYIKTAFKKVNYKAAEATGDFIGNKTADKIAKPKL